jgi:hypothetical protein
MSAHSDNRADMPRYDVSLSSQADDAIARLRGHLRANNDEQRSIAQMETVISLFERQYHMTTYTFVQRWQTGDIENTISTLMWFNVARAAGYVALPPVPQTASLTTTPPTEHALAANVGANSSDLVTSGDRGVGVEVVSAVNSHDDVLSDALTDEAGNSAVNPDAAPVETVQDEEVTASPKAETVGGQSSEYPRFHPMKGFSKAWRKVWRWLDDHAAEIDHEFPTHRTVGDANDVSHVTAGKIIKKWRDHNDIQPPVNYYQEDKAS